MPEAARPLPGLEGLRIAVTRPRRQCDAILGRLKAQNAYARCLPVVEIAPPADPGAAARTLRALDEFDLAVFTSPNAVDMAGTLLPAGAAMAVPSLRAAAVGPATGRALEAAGFTDILVPAAEFSSEGLLEHRALGAARVSGRRVLLVKGEGGRQALAKRLAERGAQVTTVEVYRRVCPEGRIIELLGEPIDGFGVIVITSGTAFDNLRRLADSGEKRQVLDATLVFASQRLAQLARERGATAE
ncbi:MAG: uroporphyrinogen-III synthase, partial [Gammaproteobacteria bacterium]|nr:uroporphyrinogen-III synthase [Gammaproteobacteria bacterium]